MPFFVGWVERRPNPTYALGSALLHPTYEKMAKVLLTSNYRRQ